MRRVALFLFALFVPLMAAAETITLKSGRVIQAEILEQTKQLVRIDFQNTPVTLYRDEIESISFDAGEQKTLKPAVSRPSPSDQTLPPVAGHNKEEITGDVIEQCAQAVVLVLAEQTDKPLLLGSGFFISDSGLLVTNLHVVLNADEVKVKTRAGEIYSVEQIVYCDDQADFCVLKSDMKNSPYLSIGDSDALLPGQKIFTIGHPQGQEYVVAYGQYLERKKMGSQEMLMAILDTDVGDSGAPLLDQGGRVVGVSVLSSQNIAGYNFGIPINAIKEFLTDAQGVSVQEFKRNINKAYELTYAGKGALLEGKNEQAMDYFLQALKIDPDYVEALAGLSQVYQLLKRNDDAFETWQEVKRLDPYNTQACVALGKFYLDRGLPDEAVENLEQAVSLAPQSVHVYNDLGFAYGKQGLPDKAIAAYEKTVEIDPYYANGYFNLALSYYEKRDMPRARMYCRKAVQLGHAVPSEFLMALGLDE